MTAAGQCCHVTMVSEAILASNSSRDSVNNNYGLKVEEWLLKAK